MTAVPLTAEAFRDRINVSRETLERLQLYLDLLKRWQRAINLVGRTTLADPWRRHVLDCAQLAAYLPDQPCRILDLGSGAGLPGLILAIMGRTGLHLVESDQRKALFLREVARTLSLDVTIHVQRIEALDPFDVDVVTARALAPLPRLLSLAYPYLCPGAFCLFLKGTRAKDELTEAEKSWMMSAHLSSSMSDPSASVLKLWEIERASLHRE